MTALRMLLVLALSAGAVVVVLFGAPTVPAVVVLAAFVLLAPGLVLVEVLGAGDALLEVVLAMMVGAAGWCVLVTAAVLAQLWEPRVTVVAVAVALGLVAWALLLRRLYPAAPRAAAGRHRFRAHRVDRAVGDRPGRHRAVLPAPYG